MPASTGGDTQAVDAKMADCVSKLQSKGYSKVSAIKICKVSMMRSAAKKAAPAQRPRPPRTTVTSNIPPQFQGHQFQKKP